MMQHSHVRRAWVSLGMVDFFLFVREVVNITIKKFSTGYRVSTDTPPCCRSLHSRVRVYALDQVMK